MGGRGGGAEGSKSTVCYDADALRLACQVVGADHLLDGSDYPHNIGDMRGCAERIEALPISAEDKALMRAGNAQRLLRLGDTHDAGSAA